MLSRIARTSFRVLTSYGLACVVLVLLLLLTFLGTLEQTHTGIFDVQKKYFESIFLVHKVGGVVPVPLPGGALLMGIFAANLMLGGLVRVRKDRRRIGILVGHTGILMLLLGSLVKFALSVEGALMLYEGESAAHFESYFDWEVTIRDAAASGTAAEFVIPLAAPDLRAGKPLVYRNGQLPFDLEIVELHRNSRPRPVADTALASAAGGGAEPTVVDGFYLAGIPADKETERNVAGLVVLVRSKSDGTAQPALLWGLQQRPLVVDAGGGAWALDLHRRRFGLPFGVRLDRFIHEEHPGTRIASDFTSHVTRLDGTGAQQTMIITMNEPLRHRGYTLYQSSWGPQDARPGEPVFSVFSVVRNPADRWPLWSCIVIAMGLLLHFSTKLGRYLRAEAGGRA
jgi:hypothetical protein